MRVRFFAYLRNFTGCAEADVPYEETAGALAHSLCDRYGVKLRQKIFPVESLGMEGDTHAEEFGSEIIILINGRHVCHLGGVAAPLKSDDRVDIFPIVAGG
jgi:molybdopterin synthase sulfur carrier subunit